MSIYQNLVAYSLSLDRKACISCQRVRILNQMSLTENSLAPFSRCRTVAPFGASNAVANVDQSKYFMGSFSIVDGRLDLNAYGDADGAGAEGNCNSSTYVD